MSPISSLHKIKTEEKATSKFCSICFHNAVSSFIYLGDKSTTVEQWTYDPQNAQQKADVFLVILENKRKFRATSFVDKDHIWQTYVDFVSSNTDYSLPLLELNNNAGTWETGKRDKSKLK